MSMSELQDKVTALLTEAGLNYELKGEENNELINLGQVCSDPAYGVMIHANEEANVVNVIGMANCFVPEDKRVKACELLNQFNHEYPHKAYLDPEDGQLMAQKCPDTDGNALNKDVLLAALGSVHSAIKHNYEVLMRLRYGN